MAKIPFGILGPFSGTVGTVTGSKWKIKDTMRAKCGPSKRDTNPTPDQEKQRNPVWVYQLAVRKNAGCEAQRLFLCV